MLDILKQLEEWSKDETRRPIYLATVAGIEGSAVRGAGATMGIAADGSLTGSVSGGCIESNAVAAVERLRPTMGSELLVFCPTDDPFMGAPAPCGGTVRVCVYPFSRKVGEALRRRSDSGKAGLWGIIVEGPSEWIGVSAALDEEGNPVSSFSDTGRVPPEGWEDVVAEVLLSGEAGKVGEAGAGSGLLEKEGVRFFLHQEEIVPHAIVAGGSHIGEALLRILKQLKWRVSIVDPRESFAAAERFVGADELLHTWPGEAFEKLAGDPGSTAVAAITHNEQMDDEAVETALRGGCFYVGVLGSSRTFAARIERLREKGWTSEQLGRVHGPIGLDIGAKIPEEIALSIAAEMVREYRKIRKEKK